MVAVAEAMAFVAITFSHGFGAAPGDGYEGYGGYGNRASGLRGGFRRYEDRDVWGHWGADYGPVIPMI
jgi:hypothetical protein